MNTITVNQLSLSLRDSAAPPHLLLGSITSQLAVVSSHGLY